MPMTDEEHRKETRRMERLRRKLDKQSKGPLSLADKLQLKTQIKELDEKLHQHKLHYYDLVTTA